ncbi:MAG: acyl carrier protein [Flavobacteriaceae bacterium]|nr:acyl carrier protein [Flavobacteriaceae bacterium]
MNKDQLKMTLTRIFKKIFDDQSISLSNEMTASDIDNWDSLSHMLLISEIEDVFSIKFKLKELNKLKNVGILIETIFNKIT